MTNDQVSKAYQGDSRQLLVFFFFTYTVTHTQRSTQPSILRGTHTLNTSIKPV